MVQGPAAGGLGQGRGDGAVMPKPNTHTNGDPAVCMVVGCSRKALYRNPLKNKTSGNKRHGYCSVHRDMAVSTHRVSDSSMEYMERAWGI